MYSINQVLKQLAKQINQPEDSPIEWKIFAEFQGTDDTEFDKSCVAVLNATDIEQIVDSNFTFSVSSEFMISVSFGDIDFAAFEADVQKFYKNFYKVLKNNNKQDIVNDNGEVVATLLGYELGAAKFEADSVYFTATIPVTLYVQA